MADAEDWWRRRRGPVAFVVAPTDYGRHWRHVRDTGADQGADTGADTGADSLRRAGDVDDDDGGEVFPARTTARVTSGYAFALVALDLTGQPLPGEWSAETERGNRGVHHALVALGIIPVVVFVFVFVAEDA